MTDETTGKPDEAGMHRRRQPRFSGVLVPSDTRRDAREDMDRYASHDGDNGYPTLSLDFGDVSPEILRVVADRGENGEERVDLMLTTDDREIVSVVVEAMQQLPDDCEDHELRWQTPDGLPRQWKLLGGVVAPGQPRVSANEIKRLKSQDWSEREKHTEEKDANWLWDEFPEVAWCIVVAVCARFSATLDRIQALREHPSRQSQEILADAVRRLPDDGRAYLLRWPVLSDDGRTKGMTEVIREGDAPDQRHGHPDFEPRLA